MKLVMDGAPDHFGLVEEDKLEGWRRAKIGRVGKGGQRQRPPVWAAFVILLMASHWPPEGCFRRKLRSIRRSAPFLGAEFFLERALQLAEGL